MTTKDLMALSGLTHGRIAAGTVFADLMAHWAFLISNTLDFIHYEERSQADSDLIAKYKDTEQQQMREGFLSLARAIEQDLEHGRWDDRLGAAFEQLGMGGRGGVFFTPPNVAEMVARLGCGNMAKLPGAGYFTMTDPACGSGVMLLAGANQVTAAGYNPCRHLVVQAVDLNITCAHMAYINLSLYGIPAVVIHGNSLTMQEFSRWYTPAYLLEKWVWRHPLPFGEPVSRSDELLKLGTNPMYAVMRQIQLLDQAIEHMSEEGKPA